MAAGGEAVRRPGARARALALVLVVAAALPWLRRAAWPTLASSSREWAGLERQGETRVHPVAAIPEALRAAAPLCPRAAPSVPAGRKLVTETCPPRLLPLALPARRVLGLSVDLNALTASDLESLRGIGPRLARQIVEHRRERGGFESVEAMGEVRGVGPARLTQLRTALNPTPP